MTSPETSRSTADPGLRPVRQAPVAPAARLDAGAVPPSELWEAVATSDGFQRALVGAVRTLLADVTHSDRVRTLEEVGVTAADGGYARLITGLERAPETTAHERALALTAGIGQDGMTVLGHLGLDELADGPLAVLDAVEETPTLAVRVGEAFRERRREQRETTLWLLGRVAQVCDVRVVSTGVTARWLVHEHRDALPAEFREKCDARRSPDGPVDELVEEARAALDPEGRAVAVLRDLADQPGETLAYDELRSRQSVSASRVSQVLGELESFDLAARLGQRSNKRVELRPAGSALLDALDAEIGRQSALDETFSNTGQSSTQAVFPRAQEGPPRPGEGTPQTVAEAGPCYRTRWLPERDHTAAAAAATDGGVTTVEAPVPGEDDAEERRTRYVSYDADRDEAVVAVRATGPLQYVVSVATALASPRFFDTVLPVDRLDDIEDPPAILRDARCIGWLSDEAVEDPAVLREEIVEAGKELAEMTTDLQYGAYEDRSRFRGDIVRTALGLAGTVVHLLDVVGVDVVRELRLPGGLDEKHLADLSRVVGISAAIQSKYGAFTIYRQLFEDREDKRQTALTPDVDAADPIGSYVGSLVVRGPDVGRFVAHLQSRLSRPAAVHDDAPEIAVEVPIEEPDRETYAETVARMCSTKSLRATREAVTLFRTFTGDPYAVSEALHWLGAEDNPREIRLDEVRVALSRLDAERLLPDAAPTVSEVLSVLLRTTSPLTRSELAEEADVSTRSLRRHMGPLVALDMVREVDGGFRLSLPDSDDERGQRIVPEPVDDGIMTLTDLLFDVALTLVEDVSRLSDPGDPVGGAFFWPPNVDVLRDACPSIRPWMRLARVLLDDPGLSGATVTIGPNPSTRSLMDYFDQR